MLEVALRCVAGVGPSRLPSRPESIFVLRNNDIGDLIVITPLFEALRRCFPDARIAVGVGPWSRAVLERNPHVDEIITLMAPWHNKYVAPQGWFRSLRYILFDRERISLRNRRFQVGLDVVGSPAGSLLLMSAGIPFRVGVRGYAGGHSATQRHIIFDRTEHVGRAALRMAELLGAPSLPENQPQLYLDPSEIEAAEAAWGQCTPDRAHRRLLLSPGAGLPEKQWSHAKWTEMLRGLASDPRWQVVITGSADDYPLAEQLRAAHPRSVNLAGRLTLRQTLGLVSRADGVVCHSSMILHAAAAWRIPTLALLGPMFSSPREHARQWGHPRCEMLGNAEPAEAIERLNRLPGLLDSAGPTDQSARIRAYSSTR